jgi:hypothetical protein
MSEIKKVERNF